MADGGIQSTLGAYPRVVTVTLAFRGSTTAIDNEALATRVIEDLRDAGYEDALLGVTVNDLPAAVARPWEVTT